MSNSHQSVSNEMGSEKYVVATKQQFMFYTLNICQAMQQSINDNVR